jgi:hypothetical protein
MIENEQHSEDYSLRIQHLEHSHHHLEKQLGKMLKHPGVDELKVAEMKKMKLQLKDQIDQLKKDHNVSS